MSVVAWDGKTLAADRQGTSFDCRQRVSKIKRREDGTIIAWVGQLDTGLIMTQWYEDGADFAKWPTSSQSGPDDSLLIVVGSNAEVITYGKWAAAQPLLEPFWAWGSGRDFAIGAMAAGMKAREAVEIASKFNTNCGLGVDAFDVVTSKPTDATSKWSFREGDFAKRY